MLNGWLAPKEDLSDRPSSSTNAITLAAVGALPDRESSYSRSVECGELRAAFREDYAHPISRSSSSESHLTVSDTSIKEGTRLATPLLVFGMRLLRCTFFLFVLALVTVVAEDDDVGFGSEDSLVSFLFSLYDENF